LVEKIENVTTPLSDFGQVIQGITPYDKYRGQDPQLIKSRGYHHSEKKMIHVVNGFLVKISIDIVKVGAVNG